MLIGIDASRARRAVRTGNETYSLQLIRHLLALDSGHRVRLYVNQSLEAGLFSDGLADVRRMPFPRLWTHLRLSWEMAQRPPDVLFVPSHVIPLWHPRRSVATVHDLGYRYFPHAHPPLARTYLDLSTRWNAQQARRVIAVSQATQRDLQRFYGIPAAKVTVVYPGVDTAWQPVRDAEMLAAVKAKYGIRHPFVLHVGTLHPRKNLVTLVRAFARLEARPELAGQPVQLVLAGAEGWQANEVVRELDQLDLHKQVILAGRVPDEDLPALYSAARCLAFPSLHEGFGFPVVEAQACGTPVLSANASSLPEVAGDGALLVPPTDVSAWADALTHILTDDARRADLVAKGQANVGRFSWARSAEAVMAVLEEVGRA